MRALDPESSVLGIDDPLLKPRPFTFHALSGRFNICDAQKIGFLGALPYSRGCCASQSP